jgi:tetratricopeptide (TPR) repeat protein
MVACGSREPLPPLPSIDTSGFLPRIRQAVDAALGDARAMPGDAEAVGRLGMVLHAHDQLLSARDCYRRASILDPKRFEWRYYLGLTSQGQDAVQAFRAAVRLRDYVPARLKLGEALLATGDSKGAREVYRGLSHPTALFGYGRATDDPSYYERALAAFPQFGAAQFALAQQYQRNGRAAEAKQLLSDYERFKLIAPPVEDAALDAVRALNQGPDALLRDAAEFERQGQLDRAVELQLQALTMDPKLTQAHINLISLYGRLGNAGGVDSHYRNAIAADPKAQEAYYNYGVFCYFSNRRKDARAAFEKTLVINEGHAGAHTNLGAILQEQGEIDDAARHFLRAVELQPNYYLARFHLGRIYANRGRYTQAIEQLERASGADDDAAPTYLYALGATQARAGRHGAAAATLGAARDKAAAKGQSALAAAIERDLARIGR